MGHNKQNPYSEDSYDKAAANLRLALSVLAEHQVPGSPLNYRLAYDLIDGRSRALNSEFKALLASGSDNLNEDLWNLYRKFYTQDEEALDLIRSELKGIVSGVVSSCSTSSGDLLEYSQRLNRLADLLNSDAASELTLTAVDAAIQDTREVAQSQQLLGAQLSDVLKEVREIRKAINEVREESHVDPLTGVSNRRAFDLTLESLIDAATEQGEPLSLLLCDIDCFKQFNDDYGHLVGDKVRFIAVSWEK